MNIILPVFDTAVCYSYKILQSYNVIKVFLEKKNNKQRRVLFVRVLSRKSMGQNCWNYHVMVTNAAQLWLNLNSATTPADTVWRHHCLTSYLDIKQTIRKLKRLKSMKIILEKAFQRVHCIDIKQDTRVVIICYSPHVRCKIAIKFCL